MYQFVSVCFQRWVTIILFFICSTEQARGVWITFTVVKRLAPSMLDILESHIAVNVIEMDHGVFAVRKFGAIQAAPGKMRGQLRNGDAVKLMLKNMIRALLQIWVQRLEALEEPFRNFT